MEEEIKAWVSSGRLKSKILEVLLLFHVCALQINKIANIIIDKQKKLKLQKL
jgi:hypothetical protein